MANPLVSSYLQQFASKDLPLATEMLEAVRIVPTSVVVDSLTASVLEVLHRSSGPVGVYATRGLANQEIYFENRSSAPQPVRRERDGTGSEAIVANLVTRLARRESSVLDHPTLDTLASSRCRHICLVDDVVGSGRKARAFLFAFLAHNTIRSWISGDRLEFHYLTYLTYQRNPFTPRALRVAAKRIGLRLRKIPPIDFTHKHHASSGRATWSTATEEGVREVCLNYARKHFFGKWRKWGDGYEHCFGFTGLEHTFPNNAPPVLWNNYVETWAPLFPGMSVPPALFDPSQSRSVPAGIASRILVAISSGRRRPAVLADMLSLPTSEVVRGIAALQVDGLVTPAGRCTPPGRAEARRLRLTENFAAPVAELQENDLYFPQRLRSARARN
jgi:hypothetical protein